MLQSAIYADLHAQDFGFSPLHRLQRLPHQVAGKISFASLLRVGRMLFGRNELQGLSGHLLRDIGMDR